MFRLLQTFKNPEEGIQIEKRGLYALLTSSRVVYCMCKTVSYKGETKLSKGFRTYSEKVNMKAATK